MSSAAEMIKRFREGKPMPRSDRLKSIEDGVVDEMWWLKGSHTKVKTTMEPRGGGALKSYDSRNYDRKIDGMSVSPFFTD